MIWLHHVGFTTVGRDVPLVEADTFDTQLRFASYGHVNAEILIVDWLGIAGDHTAVMRVDSFVKGPTQKFDALFHGVG